MKRAIVWFTTDLRLHDNETLTKAIQENDEIIPIYCFDDAFFNETAFGQKRMGTFRANFLLESLSNLKAQLQIIGSDLLILKGETSSLLCDLAKQFGVTTIYTKQHVSSEEITQLKVLRNRFALQGGSLKTFYTHGLYDKRDLPFSLRELPDTFTVFRKKIEQITPIRPALAKPSTLVSPLLPTTHLPSLQELHLNEEPKDARAVLAFRGGEKAGLARLKYYFEESRCISQYKETRNGMVGSDYSSKFSAWLALGCLSARQIYQALKTYEKTIEANESTYWLYFELLWRDYFYFVMEKYNPAFFLKGGIKNNIPKKNIHNKALFEKWKNGKTGNDFIDANMLELKQTGFMSNRGRQNVASYLCNDLHLDWRYGAAYFEEQLLDYDVHSNWGNWAYLAGVGNDPRENRYFSIEKQAKTYDTNQEFRKLWLTK